MKNTRISVKRQPSKKGAVRTLFANVAKKKKRQRASTAAAPAGGFEGDVPSLGVARALVVILIIHVIAIAGIFFHSHWLDEEEVAEVAMPVPNPAKAVMAPGPEEAHLPKIQSGDSLYTVGSGDSYESIAVRFEIPENDLRVANGNVPLRQGRYLRIPPTMVTPVEPPEEEVVAVVGEVMPVIEKVIDEPELSPDHGLVPTEAALQVDARAAGSTGTEAAPVVGAHYKVKSGDTFWAIAKKHGTTPDAVMKANGISDPRKLRPGMELAIPR